MIEGQDLIAKAREVADADGQTKCFDRSVAVAHRIANEKGWRLRFCPDMSLPEHSVLAVISSPDGKGVYVTGIVRHSDGTWSACS
jgi:hypothetical protein